MARIARVVGIGYPHHITQRGNYRQNVFQDDTDRKKYLRWIDEYSQRNKLKLLGYCLMNNHIHFIGIPERGDSLAKTFNSVHMRYSQFFNKKLGVGGHLWQGRFYSCILDERHLIGAVRYIERNPVRAKIVKNAWDYEWSSAREHIGRVESSIVKLEDLFEYIEETKYGWKEYLRERDDEQEMKEIKGQTMKGLPVGSGNFLKELEKKLGKVLRTEPRGRPWHKERNK